MSRPVFSVVVPAYNASAFIRDAIESILHQDISFPYEVIIINDGSTDDTAEVVDKYAKSVRQIIKPNGGPGSARNLGVLAAKSAIILFLDADDRAMPGRFDKQVHYMLEHPDTDVSFGNWTVQGEPENYLARYGLSGSADEFSLVEKPFENLLVRGCFIPTSTVAVQRRAYIANGMQPEHHFYAEDYALWCRIAARRGRFAFCDAAFAWYRTTSPGRLTGSLHTYSGVVEVLYQMLLHHRELLSSGAYLHAHARFAAAANTLLRHEWAYNGRHAVLERIASLEPLLPEKLRRKWMVLTLLPSFIPRIGHRTLKRFK
jgi:glycosyltransferase involved in cell wall biosynthesis